MPPAIAALLTTLALGAQAVAEPVRMSASIGGERVVIEVRNLPRPEGEAIVQMAFEEYARQLARLSLRESSSDVAHLNAFSGQGPHPFDRELLLLLQKTLGFCEWSKGAQGPVGGRLYEAWETADRPPPPATLLPLRQSATCINLRIFPETLQASLASGSKVDLRHFSTGFAVDQVARLLAEKGVSNAWIATERIARAIGPGPSGHGWLYSIPLFAGMAGRPDPVWLRDKAVAAVSAQQPRFRFGETSYSAFLDQRSGQPSSGVQAVIVATATAFDAQAIGTTLMITGNREGQLRLAGVVPDPAVMWFLGDGEGEPLISTYKWSRLRPE